VVLVGVCREFGPLPAKLTIPSVKSGSVTSLGSSCRLKLVPY